VVLNGVIVRNMKKSIEYVVERVGKVERTLHKNLLKTEKGTHAVAYDKESRFGVTYSSKKQKNDEEFKVREEEKSYAYAQKFGENKIGTEYKDIKNKDLSDLLENKSTYDTVKTHLLVNKYKDKFIKFNKNNRQEYVKIENKDIEKTNYYINSLGGKEETVKLLNTMDRCNFYIGSIAHGENLIYKLANANTSERQKIFMKNKSTYDNLKALNNSSGVSKDEKTNIGLLIDKIESLLL
jgi:hypothetical protein